MYCYRQIQDDLYWVGANNRRLAMFEGVYDVPKGVSYNAYLLLDEKTVLFDTVDASVSERLFENLDALLGDRALDYVLVQHMEPDHSATLYQVIQRYPNVQVVCNAATKKMIEQFFPCAIDDRWVETADGGSFSSGRHSFAFVKAPMVHWPEVQVTFDTTTGTLFSADAFGVFGAINGAIFADEVDFERDYMDEARRYYCNIVGKYGMQVQTLLKKAAALDIKMVCPLHGFVWRENIGSIVDKYLHWSSYTPEEQAVVIAYGSIYGGTENAAEILSVMLREKGIKTVMFDVSMTPASEIVAAAFRCEPSGVRLCHLQQRHLHQDGGSAERSGGPRHPEPHRCPDGKRHLGPHRRRPHGQEAGKLQGHPAAGGHRDHPLQREAGTARSDRRHGRCHRRNHVIFSPLRPEYSGRSAFYVEIPRDLRYNEGNT